jgi:hypothetical protein
VIDLGRDKGAHEGQTIELWRPMRVRHPLSGQMLADRFKIGTLRLTQVQSTLSLAKLDGESLRPPATGDVVVVPEGLRPQAPPNPTNKATPAPKIDSAPAPSPSPSSPAPPPRTVPADPDARALSDLFVALEGSDPASRARAYESFVEKHPKSRFAKVLREEVVALRSKKAEPTGLEPSFAPIDHLRPGTPQRFAVELDERFVGALVHVRRTGQTAYRSIAMDSLGARYWAATLPGDAITEPGAEYFVEGVTAKGPAVMLIGTADAPKRAEVEPHPVSGKQPGTLAQVNAWSEYASFNVKKQNDYLFQTEGNFGWRRRDDGIRAIRSGFGVLRGEGASLQDLEANKAARSVGLTYGYVEVEIGFSPTYGLIGRPIVGLRENGVSGGAQGFFRIGNDLKTNILIGGEVLGSIGLRGVVQLDWRTIKRVPIMLRSEVTNQPAGSGGDVGARAIAQVGYEIARDLIVSARASYQGRTINHAGPGAGLGVGYQW